MITGFNTDIEYEGVVYHVQTEDKGLDSPLILSLVYAGGAILASKRSPYQDLIASGFDEEALAQRLKRQHRLICAAISAGRIEELKRMGERGEDKAEGISAAPPAQFEIVNNAFDEATPIGEPLPAIEIVDNASDYPGIAESPPEAAAEDAGSADLIVGNASDFAGVLETSPDDPDAEVESPEPDQVSTSNASAYTVHDSRRDSPLGEPTQPDGLKITILDEQEFWAGGNFHIRIMVGDRSNQQEQPVPGASLSVKVLGTTFRPQLYSVKTEGDGVAVVSAQIPRFTSGRAAILIRAATIDGRSTETRRVIHAAK